MSSSRPPARAPLPASVYRRRRLMVAGTAVALVVAGVDLVRGDDETPTPTAQRVVATPTPSAAPTDEPVFGPRKGGKRRTKQPTAPVTPVTPPAPPPAEPDGPCADADVVVTPVMAPALAGRPVLVTLALRTVESEACTWTISRDHLAYKITADGDDVWSSSQCPGQVPDDTIVVRRDLTATYRLAWNGRESSRDCPVSMPYAEPGDYAVQAAAIGGEPSAVVPFTLTDPAEVVVPDGPLGPEVPGADTSGGKKGKGKKGRGKNKASGR